MRGSISASGVGMEHLIVIDRWGTIRPHEQSAENLTFRLGLVALAFDTAPAPWLIPVSNLDNNKEGP
jgi:hypothetical protein